MSNATHKHHHNVGLSPGSLVHIGDIHEKETKISAIKYSNKSVESVDINSIENILNFKDSEEINWVNIDGLQDIQLIEFIGKNFNIHPLVLEDILDTNQRPKFEQYDDFQYIVLKNCVIDRNSKEVNYEQVSMLVMNKLVITFKEKSDHLFTPLIKRLKSKTNQFRSNGVDYLTYVILDAIVDNYFVTLSTLDEVIDDLDEELIQEPTLQTLNSIRKIKRDLIYIRRSASPLRGLLSTMMRSESSRIESKTFIYFQDVYDHVMRITETLELQKDMVHGLQDMYQTIISNKINETMRVLTAFAAVFIPLTFIAGVYGMNFEYMPELKWKYSYPVIWVIFIAITVGSLSYFRKKKWV